MQGGMLNGSVPIAKTYVSEVSHPSNQGRSLAIVMSSWQIGMMVRAPQHTAAHRSSAAGAACSAVQQAQRVLQRAAQVEAGVHTERGIQSIAQACSCLPVAVGTLACFCNAY